MTSQGATPCQQKIVDEMNESTYNSRGAKRFRQRLCPHFTTRGAGPHTTPSVGRCMRVPCIVRRLGCQLDFPCFCLRKTCDSRLQSSNLIRESDAQAIEVLMCRYAEKARRGCTCVRARTKTGNNVLLINIQQVGVEVEVDETRLHSPRARVVAKKNRTRSDRK